MRMSFLLHAGLSVGLLLLVGCSGSKTSTVTNPPPAGITDPPVPTGANVVIQWHNATLQAIRDTKPGPPMTARALAIVHTCMFDAWAAYSPMANGTQYGGDLRRPAEEQLPGRISLFLRSFGKSGV